MPSQVAYGNFITNTSSTADRTLSYAYGPEHQRVRENVSLTGTGTSSYFAGNTWYLNGEDSLGLTYEKEVRANGTTENKHYLMAGGQVFAVFTSRTGTLNGLAASTTSYFQHDQLGSIAVVTDENGVVKERLAYDPWGKRRNIMSSPGTPDTRDLLVGKYTNRGFTEHEHLDEIGMIHMNGRIYDPLIGRFMSADSLIEAPDQLASYNRYSYVWNNPLNRVDPSGFCWICNPIGETFKTLNHIGDVIASDPVARTLVTVAIAYYTGQWATNSLGFSAIGSGALGGAASSAFASNGDINAIAVGAVTGAGFGWAGGVGGADSFARYAAHASVGCVSAVASGGSCGAGAASAVFGKYTTNAIGDIGGSGISAVIARGVATAVAGGVGAVIAGGSFENGARTAAFGYLFNELQHYQGTSDERLRMGGYEIKDYIRYEQSSGQMYLIDGLTGSETSLGQGYAGRGVGFNNPEAQNTPNIGPIPEGLYSIGPIRDNRVRIGLPNERVMESSLRLTPMTNIGSRAGFLIHSDFGVTTASNGCICTPLTVRQAVANTGVTRLQVVK